MNHNTQFCANLPKDRRDAIVRESEEWGCRETHPTHIPPPLPTPQPPLDTHTLNHTHPAPFRLLKKSNQLSPHAATRLDPASLASSSTAPLPNQDDSVTLSLLEMPVSPTKPTTANCHRKNHPHTACPATTTLPPLCTQQSLRSQHRQRGGGGGKGRRADR